LPLSSWLLDLSRSWHGAPGPRATKSRKPANRRTGYRPAHGGSDFRVNKSRDQFCVRDTLATWLESGEADQEGFGIATSTRARPRRHSCASRQAGLVRGSFGVWATGVRFSSTFRRSRLDLRTSTPGQATATQVKRRSSHMARNHKADSFWDTSLVAFVPCLCTPHKFGP
jgi:hypothetical protein